MFKEKTNIRKTYNYIIRIVIVLVTYGFIYRQVFRKRHPDEIISTFHESIMSGDLWVLFALLILLMLLNWGLESFKWRILISKVEKISFFKAYQAVLTGVSVSLFTPNRTGDYLGRVFILDKANRIEGVLITLIGSFAQLLVTFSVGMFCLLAFLDQYIRVPYRIEEYFFTAIIFFIPVVVFLSWLMFFKIGLLTDFAKRYLPDKWGKLAAYAGIFSRYSTVELLKVLIISLLRYVVFSTQFYLLLRMFEVNLPWQQGLILIPVIYLAMAMVPSIALVDLGIRGSVSIFVIGLYFRKYGAASPGTELAILSSSTMLWFINLIVPAILGTFFVFRLKFFRK